MEKLYIRNTIGWHVTAEQFTAQFNDALDTGDEIGIYINSPGGSVYQGWDIFNQIRGAIAEGATIKTYNIGLAASMGSVLLLAAEPENRFTAENSMFMIHNPSGFAFGDEEKMQKERELLGKIGDLMSSYYAKVTKTDKEYMKALMKLTSWYKPKELVSEGFIPSGNIVDGGKPIEKVKVTGMDKSAFTNSPNQLGEILCFTDEMPILNADQSPIDLTKMTNSEIRERTWKNYLKY